MKIQTSHTAGIVLGVALIGLCTTAALSQQPQPAVPSAPPAGRGGFRHAPPADFNDNKGWTKIFDGTFNGWSGDENWNIKEGAIHIESTCEKPSGTVYIVWQGGEVSDFMLKAEMKGTVTINSGIQYRSWLATDPNGQQPPGRAGGAGGGGAAGRGPAGPPCPSGQPRGMAPSGPSEAKWSLSGPQYDFDNGNQYSGQFFEQNGRGIIVWKGEIVEALDGGMKQLISPIENVDPVYKKEDWNTVEVVAVGNVMTHFMNGRLMSEFIDNDRAAFHSTGKIGIQAQSFGELWVRNIWLKKL